MTKRIGKRTKGAVIFAVATLAFAGAGVAYFTATGSGSGSLEVANMQPLTVSPAAPAGSALYPGGSADVAATVHNPGADSVHVHSFVLDVTQPSDGIANDESGCTSGGNTGSSTNSVTFNGPVLHDSGATDFVFPHGDTTLTLPSALSMSATAENACQGATFTVYLQASS